MVKKPIKERFYRHFVKTKTCWVWTAGKTGHGYGTIRKGGCKEGQVMAHRVSWEIHIGPIPEGMCVLHKCDNPPCVRPSHLFIGTMKDNTSDMIRKGRAKFGGPKGEKHGRAKLTEKLVRKIRRDRVQGDTYTEIGKRYGVPWQTVGAVCKRKTWKHVK